MSRIPNTGSLKWRVQLGGWCFAYKWASSVAYKGSSNIVQGVANMSTLRIRVGLSFWILNIHDENKTEHIPKTLIWEDNNASKQARSFEKLMHTTNWYRPLPSSGEEEQKPTLLWGNLQRSVLLLKLKYGEEDKLVDVDVRLKHWVERHATS